MSGIMVTSATPNFGAKQNDLGRILSNVGLQ